MKKLWKENIRYNYNLHHFNVLETVTHQRNKQKKRKEKKTSTDRTDKRNKVNNWIWVYHLENIISLYSYMRVIVQVECVQIVRIVFTHQVSLYMNCLRHLQICYLKQSSWHTSIKTISKFKHHFKLIVLSL